MELDNNGVGLGLVILGTLLSLGREILALWVVRLFGFLNKQPFNPRLVNGVKIYLALMGMIFTVVGVLGLLHIIAL